MAHALPIHVIDEIERRWQRRLDERLPAKAGVNDECGAELCPRCSALATIRPGMSGSAVTHLEYACHGCGHAWRTEAL